MDDINNNNYFKFILNFLKFYKDYFDYFKQLLFIR